MSLRATLGTALVFLLSLGAFLFIRSYNAAVAKAAQVPELRAQVEDLEARHERLATEVIRRAELDEAIRRARTDTTHRIEAISREETPDGAYLRQRIPERVRDAARTDR